MHSDWISKKAHTSLNPLQVERALTQIEANWPADAPPFVDFVENFPLGESALLHLLAMSHICSSRLAEKTEILLWLAQPEICSVSRSYGEMRRAVHGLTQEAVAAENFRALRRWKGQEMTRIALRELADVAPLEETTAELSQLAEICLAEVYEHWDAYFRQRYGSPETDFAIFGLGKLGGCELNHSSDIDLIFVYGEEGQVERLSTHEWFNRLCEKITETFASADREGALFRIDLRLRPEGSAGPLARSLVSMENYYAGFGETWERLALIKARALCGSRELGYEFLRQLQPFIYPKSPTPDLLDEIAAIKRRIERDVVGQKNLEWNVKLGAGGIREIEFVIQALQLIHGARHAFLQQTSTLKALRSLCELDLLPREEVLALDRAYGFLRQVEHRLQIEGEQQTHTVPRQSEQLRRLALSLGYASNQKFSEALQATMQSVRAVFRRVISHTPVESAAIDLSMFADQKRAANALTDLGQSGGSFHIAPRTRQVFRNLRPLLLERLRKTADPDTTLNYFLRFVEAYGLRSLLLELLVTHPRLLELLVRTLDASHFGAELLIRRPQLLDEITQGETLDRSIGVEEHLARLSALACANLDPLRAYYRTHWFRICIRDVLGLGNLGQLFNEHSTLTEAVLLFANQISSSNELTIIALGKFGGREISYGADLDVLFVGDDVRAAQNLVSAVAQPSGEGNLPALDSRLRPDGEKGPLACSLDAYEAYYQQRAQLWEIHALTRARPITGPLQNEFAEMAQRIWRARSARPDLFEQIDNMFERIRRDRGSGNEFLDFKTGTGGIIQAEFLVHALQMKVGMWAPNWTSALGVLTNSGTVSTADAANAERTYGFLRRTESTLRRWENKSVSVLPADPIEQCRLAIRLGCAERSEFVRQYSNSRETIAALYQRYLKRSGGT
jgi:glutamate-ammonia-ligase adenylyltransferase